MGRCADIMNRAVATDAVWTARDPIGNRTRGAVPAACGGDWPMARVLRYTSSPALTKQFYREEQLHVRAVMDLMYHIDRRANSQWLELGAGANGPTNADMDDKRCWVRRRCRTVIEVLWNNLLETDIAPTPRSDLQRRCASHCRRAPSSCRAI